MNNEAMVPLEVQKIPSGSMGDPMGMTIERP